MARRTPTAADFDADRRPPHSPTYAEIHGVNVDGTPLHRRQRLGWIDAIQAELVGPGGGWSHSECGESCIVGGMPLRSPTYAEIHGVNVDGTPLDRRSKQTILRLGWIDAIQGEHVRPAGGRSDSECGESCIVGGMPLHSPIDEEIHGVNVDGRPMHRRRKQARPRRGWIDAIDTDTEHVGPAGGRSDSECGEPCGVDGFSETSLSRARLSSPEAYVVHISPPLTSFLESDAPANHPQCFDPNFVDGSNVDGNNPISVNSNKSISTNPNFQGNSDGGSSFLLPEGHHVNLPRIICRHSDFGSGGEVDAVVVGPDVREESHKEKREVNELDAQKDTAGYANCSGDISKDDEEDTVPMPLRTMKKKRKKSSRCPRRTIRKKRSRCHHVTLFTCLTDRETW